MTTTGGGYWEHPATDRLFVDSSRTVLVRIWENGTVEVALRDEPSHTWGPPITCEEEKT